MNENSNGIENIELNNNIQPLLPELKRITAKEANYVFIISTFFQIIIGLGLEVILFLTTYLIHVGDETVLYYYFVSPLTELSAIFFPVLFYFLIKKIDFKKALRLNKVQLKHILPLIIIAISAQYAGGFLNYIVTFLLNFLGKVPAQDIPVPKTILELSYTIFFIAAVPAIFEELLARGLIMRGYEGYGAKHAITISALLFGLMHYDLTNLIFPIFLGLILGFVVYRTNSIFSGIIVHFVNNAYGACMLYFWGKGGDNIVEPSSLQELLTSSIPAAIGLVLIGGFLYYIYKTTEDNMDDEKTSKLETKNQSSFKILLHWPLILSYGLMIVVIATTIYKIISGIE